MTDENPLLSPEEHADQQRLDEFFRRLDEAGPQAIEEAQLEQCRRRGAIVGALHEKFGSNVAMAYFHAGMAYTEIMAPHRHDIDSKKHYATFFDGFSSTYWVNVTDQQKEGPYS